MLASSHSSWKQRALQAQQNILSWVYMDTTIHLILFTLVCLVSLHWHNKTSYLCYVLIGSSYDLERLTTSYVLYAFKGSCASWVYNSSTHLISITRWKAPLTTWLAPMRVQIRLPMGHKVYSYKKKSVFPTCLWKSDLMKAKKGSFVYKISDDYRSVYIRCSCLGNRVWGIVDKQNGYIHRSWKRATMLLYATLWTTKRHFIQLNIH